MRRTTRFWIKRIVRRALRWYGIHGHDRGKYRIVNYLAPKLTDDVDHIVTAKAPHGFDMVLDLNEHIQQRAYYFGYHERMVVETFARHLFLNTTVFDVGANFGQFSLLAAQMVGNGGNVVAFEPAPLAYAALVRNVEQNNFQQVLCRPVAVSETRGIATFYASPSNDQGTGSLSREAVERYHIAEQAFSVEVEQLDDYVDRFKQPVSIIKMDIQGAELMALRGATRLLSKYHPVLVIEVDDEVMHAFGYTAQNTCDYIRNFGYSLYSIPTRPWEKVVRLDPYNKSSHDLLCIFEQ